MRHVRAALRWMALGSATVLPLACASGGQTARTAAPMFIDRAAPILHTGLNGYWHGGIDAAIPSQLPHGIVMRSAVQSVAQAQSVLDHYPGPVLLLVETVDPSLVSALSTLRVSNLVGIELGNELELSNVTAQDYGTFVLTSTQLLLAAGWPYSIISGGVYAITPDTITYLTTAGAKTWPQAVTIGVHWYEDVDDSLLAQLQALGHPIAITETGMPSRTPAEDAAQLSFLQHMKLRAQQLGAQWWIVYQAMSGPGASNLDNFGLFRFDATPKPALAVLP